MTRSMQTAIRQVIFFLLVLVFLVHETRCSPPPDPVMCFSGNSNNCTVINAYGAFPDRATCRACMAVYPSSEEELIKAVAMATQRKTKMKVATKYSHSIPKLACPGGEEGLIISTRNLNRVLSVNFTSMTMTVESGMLLRDIIAAAADAGLALPNAPYWWGLTVGGMLAAGSHGSTLIGKGSAVHEYVVDTTLPIDLGSGTELMGDSTTVETSATATPSAQAESTNEGRTRIRQQPYWMKDYVTGHLARVSAHSKLRKLVTLPNSGVTVVALRVVTPASGDKGFARVRSLEVGDREFDAVRVSLGVLGVVSQVTLKLDPIFKRSITYIESNDSDLAVNIVDFGKQYEFAHIYWFPGHKKAAYSVDFRVPTNTTGDGSIDLFESRPTPVLDLVASRLEEEAWEATNNTEAKCNNSGILINTLSTAGYGLTNNGTVFTGYPVIGFQNKLQSSGSCLDSNEDNLTTVCSWDPRVRGSFFQQSTFTIALSKVKDFILDVQKLRDIRPSALCGLDLYGGILIRYVKGSTAFMGEQEDSVDFDITYYRSYDPMSPKLDEDFIEEIEQMGLFKYGGLPHWGKDRNLAYDGVAKKYAKIGEFLKVKEAFDPHGLFSSEWSDQVLGIQGRRTSIVRDGCALEGLCVCSEDSHCSPANGYFCRPGKVYTDARVCSKVELFIDI
ncbi:hypothetical protein J5N97_021642 [Dioscorea zingiberensis]|uniref:L-gulonolactone oxidase n=1 Tax=Dioscorea zingiberensis TaxID=325984 RepID=A0A9D5C9Q2_9LILI|nr:hypothetical protein J5N97_021642 [Dioscorea zingiberensis]